MCWPGLLHRLAVWLLGKSLPLSEPQFALRFKKGEKNDDSVI